MKAHASSSAASTTQWELDHILKQAGPASSLINFECFETIRTTRDKESLIAYLSKYLPFRNTSGQIDPAQISRQIMSVIAAIDALLNHQVNAIIHHPRFQKLESSWRGLQYLVDQTSMYDEEQQVRIRVLNQSWQQLGKDLDRAIEFDQSEMFRRVYSDEFDTPGGEPFGLLLGDYEITHKPQPGTVTNDVQTLRSISSVAAAAFAPFIASAHPSLLGLDDFNELGLGQNLSSTFRQPEYTAWNSLRDTEDSRFLGLVMPQVMVRAPYRDDGTRRDRFIFREQLSTTQDYLWGNAVYAFGAVVIRSFCHHGWFANIRGFQRGEINSGLVTDLPVDSYNTDKYQLINKPAVETLIGDRLEKELNDLGLIPVSPCKESNHMVFYTNSSLQRPAKFDTQAASVNARLSTMLQYMLCVSRFAHYMKVIARDKIGSFASAEDCERQLNEWLMQYATANDDATSESKAKHPLREFKVEIREQPGKPGSYSCITHLKPHFQLDQLVSSVRLVTELVTKRR